MKKKLLVGLASGLFLVGMGGVASAALVGFDFDYGDKMHSLNDQRVNYLQVSSGGLTVELSAMRIHHDTNGNISDAKHLKNSLWGGDKGIGVKKGKNDETEIDGDGRYEGVLLEFSQSVILRDIDLNYFGSNDDYNLNIDATALLDDYDNTSSAHLTSLGIQSSRFLLWADHSSDEFYLGNFDVDYEPVPEPATMLLFGTGLAGLAGSRLRRKKKA